jgi:molecular chaperone DnaK
MLGGQRKTPEEISAEILKNIKSYAERVLGEPVTHAVITVPAYFGEPERAATRDAGRAAGLVVKQLLPEPTAAAIAFGTEAKLDRRLVLVYDLGGGTFDISILSVVQGKDGRPSYNVMEVGGDHFLGGDDFDLVIVKMILDHVKEKHGLDLSTDPQFLTVAKQHAEQAKKILSAEESATIIVPEAFQKDGKPVHVSMRVQRAEFEKQIAPLVERARGLVVATLKAQTLSPDLINDVLLVGGSTSVPLVGKSVEGLFGRDKVRHTVNPMNCVAMGAGILAGQMRGVECPQCKGTQDESADQCTVCGASLAVAESKIEGMEITDIANNHFGIQAVKGEDVHAFWPLVEKGTRLPMKEPRFHTFFTAAADQGKIKIPVFEGLGGSVEQNSIIGVIEYEPPVPLPINQPVRVGLQVDRQSIIKVTLEVEDFNIRYEGELKREAAEVDQPSEEPLIEEDEHVDEGERNIAILERYLDRADRFRSEYEQLLGAPDRRKLEQAIADGRKVYEEERSGEAMEAIMKLDRALNSCGAASLIEQARLVAAGAPPETADKLNQLAENMLERAHAGDLATLAKLRDPVASLIRQEHRRSMQVDQVESARTYGDLLRGGDLLGGDKR